MYTKIVLAACLILLTSAKHAEDWGFFGHKKINELAIYVLPPELQPFYKAHASDIIKWAVAPDQRRYVITEEGAKHYIDLDEYDTLPLPKYWNQAVAKYGEAYLRERGIVPWNTYFVYKQLVKALSANPKDYTRIIRLSADLGHYIADAHVPLHTTSNYDGQQTGQLGIHAFWESRLPELYFDTYDLFTNRATYIKDVQAEIWTTVMESNALLPKVLATEKELTLKLGEDKKYAYLQRGKRVVRMPSEYFSNKYNEQVGGTVEQRMRKAIYRVSCLWYSAWIDAGQPELKVDENLTLPVPESQQIGEGVKVRAHDY